MTTIEIIQRYGAQKVCNKMLAHNSAEVLALLQDFVSAYDDADKAAECQIRLDNLIARASREVYS